MPRLPRLLPIRPAPRLMGWLPRFLQPSPAATEAKTEDVAKASAKKLARGLWPNNSRLKAKPKAKAKAQAKAKANAKAKGKATAKAKSQAQGDAGENAAADADAVEGQPGRWQVDLC